MRLGLMLLLGIALSSAATVFAGCDLTKRSVYNYPLVLKGAAAVNGARIDRFRVLAYSATAKTWQEIPFQIDEVDKAGDYVLAGGIPYTRDLGNGMYDGGDEMAVDASKLGDDFVATDLKVLQQKVAQDRVRAWKVMVCTASGFAGAALIMEMQFPIFRSPAHSEVEFSAERKELNASAYHYVFNANNPALLGQVFLKDRAGIETPVFADSQFALVMRTPWWLPNLSFHQNDFKGILESWQQGPVRTIVAVGVKFSKFLKIFNFHLFSELVFYKNAFQIPTVIDFPFNANRYLNPGSGIAYVLSFPKGKTWNLQTNLVDLPQQSPDDIPRGHWTAESPHERFFTAGRSSQGAFRVEVRVDERAQQLVPPPSLVRAHMFGETPWAEHWGWLDDLVGDLGVFVDFSGVTKGTYDFGLDLVLSDKADESFADYGSAKAEWVPF